MFSKISVTTTEFFSYLSTKQIVTHSFPQPTLETLRVIINMARYEQRQPRIPLKDMTIQEVINTLRSVAQTTDKDLAYNSEDTIEGNLSKKTGVFIPDSMDEANIMRSKVMEVFNSFSNDIRIKSNFTLILSEVERWIKRLRS